MATIILELEMKEKTDSFNSLWKRNSPSQTRFKLSPEDFAHGFPYDMDTNIVENQYYNLINPSYKPSLLGAKRYPSADVSSDLTNKNHKNMP